MVQQNYTLKPDVHIGSSNGTMSTPRAPTLSWRAMPNHSRGSCAAREETASAGDYERPQWICVMPLAEQHHHPACGSCSLTTSCACAPCSQASWTTWERASCSRRRRRCRPWNPGSGEPSFQMHKYCVCKRKTVCLQLLCPAFSGRAACCHPKLHIHRALGGTASRMPFARPYKQPVLCLLSFGMVQSDLEFICC